MMKLKIVLPLLLFIIASVGWVIHAQSTYNTTNFIIYNLANAPQSFVQDLANYLQNAYNLYTSDGMKMALPCRGSQYTVYVVSSLPGTEAGVTEWMYNYDPSTGQIINACIKYINISASLTTQWLEVTAYHELVHVSQAAYWQYASVVQAYPWYMEANPEGFAEYYTNYCALTTNYFTNNLYEVNPYSYGGKAQLPMYEYSSFFYWLLSIGVDPATIMQSVFTTSTVDVPWLDNYYVQYLLSLVHGQNLCGTTYYPTWQTITFSSSGTQTVSVSLQGFSAQYYEIKLPGSGSIKIAVSGGTVDSNLLLNQSFEVTNNTLYMAVVNPTNSSEIVIITISYSQGLTVRLIEGTYNVTSQALLTTMYIEVNGAPVSGTVVINGTTYTASNGYVTAQFSGITWGNYIINVTYNGAQGTTTINLKQPSITEYPSQLYITQSSHGYIYVTINNPNTINITTKMIIAVPPTDLGKPSLSMTFNSNLNLNPGSNTVPIYFTVVSPVQGNVTIYLYVGPNTSIQVSFPVTPVTVSIINATYDWLNNETDIKVDGGPVGQLMTNLRGLSGTVYVNYTTYILTTLNVSLPRPILTNVLPVPKLVTPSWWVGELGLSINYSNACPNYQVTYTLPLTINTTQIGNIELNCGVHQVMAPPINESTGTIKLTVSIGTSNLNTVITVNMPPVDLTANITPYLIAPGWWLGNLTATMRLTQCPYNATYEVPMYINNEYLGMYRLGCGTAMTYINTINVTGLSTTVSLSIGINSTQVMASVGPPELSVSPIKFLFTDNAIYAEFNLTVIGKYKYLITNEIISGNTTITLSYKEPPNATNIVINTGFANITEAIPRPTVSMVTNTTVTAYPGTALINLTIQTPSHVYINITVTININGTKYWNKTITLGPNETEMETINYTPAEPGIYVATLSTPINSQSLNMAFIEVRSLVVVINPFNLVGNTTELEITAKYYPSWVNVNATLNLSGCTVGSLSIPVNTTHSLTFSKPCTLVVNAKLANRTAYAEAQWGYLDIVPIYTALGYINGTPVILVNSSVAISVMNNGTKLPAQVVINSTTTNETVVTGMPREVLSIKASYYGQVNTTELTFIVVPQTYVEAKQYEAELSPEASAKLDELIDESAVSGNWTLVNQIINYHNATEGWPLTNELMNYLVSQYLLTEDPYYLHATNYLAQYPWIPYAVITMVALLIAVSVRRCSKAQRGVGPH